MNLPVLTEQHGSRTGGALIERQDVFHLDKSVSSDEQDSSGTG
jgi:hypothetical protein